ncbi:sensor histidine kinase [Novosphingobium sp. 9]|uniref:sensor histidine kinase n=1 Tax=Novosphingobium sp. 9 TaxID=2025349 RepID=UPI0021B593A8|nr:PAS domain-containing protein [Novosphingobium sp. 9]
MENPGTTPLAAPHSAPSTSTTSLADLQRAMLDTTPDCIKVIAPDGNLVTMNRAGCVALGVDPASGFGMPWAPLLPPEIQVAAEAALERARAGHVARFSGRSEFNGLVFYWDNLLTPVLDADGGTSTILCVSRDITETTLLERQLEEAVAREKLMAREIAHRIKNLFSVVSSLSHFAEREARNSNGSKSPMALFRAKVEAIWRSFDAVFSDNAARGSDFAHLDLQTLLISVLQPYYSQCSVHGDRVSLPETYLSTLSLVTHELMTNAVKYGAISRPDGEVNLHWSAHEGILDLVWEERGGPPLVATPEHRGFGSDLIDRLLATASGTITREWAEQGLTARISLPLRP